MKKIKRFKISLRFREVLRNLKAISQITEITPQLEDAVKREIKHFEEIIEPSAIYETVLVEKIDFDLKVEAVRKWIAASFYVITIGSEAEQELSQAKSSTEDILAQILKAVFMESLERSAQFVNRLLNEEAKTEGCELSPRTKVDSIEMLEKICASLPCGKIGVKLLEDGTFLPVYSSCGVILWIPLKKRGSKK